MTVLSWEICIATWHLGKVFLPGRPPREDGYSHLFFTAFGFRPKGCGEPCKVVDNRAIFPALPCCILVLPVELCLHRDHSGHVAEEPG